MPRENNFWDPLNIRKFKIYLKLEYKKQDYSTNTYKQRNIFYQTQNKILQTPNVSRNLLTGFFSYISRQVFFERLKYLYKNKSEFRFGLKKKIFLFV